jgi:hypothetical protein
MVFFVLIFPHTFAASFISDIVINKIQKKVSPAYEILILRTPSLIFTLRNHGKSSQIILS